MTENRGLEFIDYLIIIAKWKKFLTITFLTLTIISYLLIYFFIKERYDARALIIPSEQTQSGGLTSLLKDFSSLPINIEGMSVRNDNDFYTAIIYSRTNLEKIIRKYNLINKYNVKNMEEAIKVLALNIKTTETDEDAYQITVSADNPKAAALMANFIIDELNKTVIDLNIKKTRDNRIFLEKRYTDIKTNLKNAEDSLRIYQQKSGMFAAEDQAKSVIGAYANLESELATKKVELSVYEKIYGKNSPQTNSARIAEEQLSNQISLMKNGNDDNILTGLNTLPTKAMNYFRYYRDVEIYNSMLKFIIPLYEQARFDEQKNIPILQVIDYAVPPVKRSFPQRTLMALGVALAITLLLIMYLITKEILRNTNNPKILLLKRELSLSRNRDNL